LYDDLGQALDATETLTHAAPEALERLDVDGHRASAVPLLREASRLAREADGPGADLDGAELVGTDLRPSAEPGRDLRAASLRSAVLLGADLRGTDLGRADLTGADLRAADLRGADLSRTLFLTQPQLDSARGDAHTRIPEALRRPQRWWSTDARG
jgi:hypothetical protein